MEVSSGAGTWRPGEPPPGPPATFRGAWQLKAPGGLPQRVGQVDVALRDDGAVQVRELPDHLGHHLLQQVLLLAALHIVLAGGRGHAASPAKMGQRRLVLLTQGRDHRIVYLGFMVGGGSAGRGRGSCWACAQRARWGGLPYLIGSDRKHKPQANLTFCQKESAAMALLKVTGMGRSPRWNLQKGTLLAWSRG